MTSLPKNVEVRRSFEIDRSEYSIADRVMIEALERAEERHFWHLSRNRFIGDQLRRVGAMPPARILELGCGSGAVSAALARSGYDVIGVDGHVARVVTAARRAPGARFIVDDLAAPGSLEDLAGVDVVGLFDVLEHLDDPRSALLRALGLARGGGLVVGTVPAMMALWSAADEIGRHRLRYELRDLERLLGSLPDAEAVDVRPFNRCLVPLLRLRSHLSRQNARADSYFSVPWGPVNVALYALLRLEHRLERCVPRKTPGPSIWFAIRTRFCASVHPS